MAVQQQQYQQQRRQQVYQEAATVPATIPVAEAVLVAYPESFGRRDLVTEKEYGNKRNANISSI